MPRRLKIIHVCPWQMGVPKIPCMAGRYFLMNPRMRRGLRDEFCRRVVYRSGNASLSPAG